MTPFRACRVLPLIAMTLLATAAQAQDRLLAPLNAAASVPPSTYHSALSDYRSNVDPQPVAWRAVNDIVGQGGGHAGHSMGPAKSADSSGMAAAPTHPATSAKPAKPKQPGTKDAAHQHKHEH